MSNFDRRPTHPTWLSRHLESQLHGKDKALRRDYEAETQATAQALGMCGIHEDHILGVLKLAVEVLIPKPHWKQQRIQPWEMNDMPTLVKAYCDELHSRAAFVKDVGLEQTMLNYFTKENDEHFLMDKYTQLRTTEDGYMTRLGKAVRPSIPSTSHLSDHQLGNAMAGLVVVSAACVPKRTDEASLLLGIDESDEVFLKYELAAIRQASNEVLHVGEQDHQHMRPPQVVARCVEEVAEVAVAWFVHLDMSVDDLDRLARTHQFTRSVRFIRYSIRECQKASLFCYSNNTYTREKPKRMCMNKSCSGLKCNYLHDPVWRPRFLEGNLTFAKL